eukprot:TRINITY_DN2660_c0_g1_i2.p2 TRINITY_DN2660_c0_g1~~TRINITY_DN2660_c0_g1_i2.p2  ORF type:complete len:112 (-),score=29.30 TRINITY_DN2660_c0_g1_i2:7-342(-)
MKKKYPSSYHDIFNLQATEIDAALWATYDDVNYKSLSDSDCNNDDDYVQMLFVDRSGGDGQSKQIMVPNHRSKLTYKNKIELQNGNDEGISMATNFIFNLWLGKPPHQNEM